MHNMDIDWTIAVQLVMFLFAMAMLSHFLFKPMMAVFARRATFTDKPLQDAADLKKEAELKQAAVEEGLAATRREIERLRADLLGKASSEERGVVAAARDEAGVAMAASREDLAKAAATARQTLRREAEDLAESLANKLLEVQR